LCLCERLRSKRMWTLKTTAAARPQENGQPRPAVSPGQGTKTDLVRLHADPVSFGTDLGGRSQFTSVILRYINMLSGRTGIRWRRRSPPMNVKKYILFRPLRNSFHSRPQISLQIGLQVRALGPPQMVGAFARLPAHSFEPARLSKAYPEQVHYLARPIRESAVFWSDWCVRTPPLMRRTGLPSAF
jgi:hypothetical protein